MSSIANAKRAEGNSFYAKKEYRQAIECYTEAIKNDPTNHILYSNRAMAYSALSKWGKAKEDGLECIRLDKTFLKGYHRAANALINLGEYVMAEEVLNEGLVYNANDISLLSLLKIAAPKAKEINDAARSKLPPVERFKSEGNEHFKVSRFVDAINSYSKAIASAGNNPEMTETLIACYNNRAACNQQLGNYENVIEDESHVIEYDPKNVKALLRRGLAFESLERYRSALDDIRAVLAINPSIEMANKAQHRIGNAVRQLKQQS